MGRRMTALEMGENWGGNQQNSVAVELVKFRSSMLKSFKTA